MGLVCDQLCPVAAEAASAAKPSNVKIQLLSVSAASAGSKKACPQSVVLSAHLEKVQKLCEVGMELEPIYCTGGVSTNEHVLPAMSNSSETRATFEPLAVYCIAQGVQ